jgi:hypothetical protein
MKQRVSLSEEKNRQSGPTQYASPSAATIGQFAKDVCVDLAHCGRSEFAAKEASWSLGNFLNLVADLTTKQLNRRSKKTDSVKELV